VFNASAKLFAINRVHWMLIIYSVHWEEVLTVYQQIEVHFIVSPFSSDATSTLYLNTESRYYIRCSCLNVIQSIVKAKTLQC
jgi:hypothetical protein